MAPLGASLGRVVMIVVDSTLPHAEFGRNDYREDVPHSKFWQYFHENAYDCVYFISFERFQKKIKYN